MGENKNKSADLSELRHLMGHIVKTIDLPSFVESETGESIQWVIQDVSAKCCCPLHREEQPSFHMNFKDDEIWVFHCFSGDTKVITWDGAKPIKKLAGTTQRILTKGQKWVDAPFYSYGNQNLAKITLTRNRQKKVIYSTRKHRWFLHKVKGERTTDQLKSGDVLESCFPKKNLHHVKSFSQQGIQNGIVFGDGTRCSNGKGSVLNLWGKKDGQLIRHFPLNRKSDAKGESGIEGVRILDLPTYYKNAPSIEESSSYLCGFLTGWIAADGHVAKDGTIMLNSSKKEDLEFVRTVANRLGIGTYGITKQNRKGINGEFSNLYRVHFINEDMDERFFLIKEHKERFLSSIKKYHRRRWKVKDIELDAKREEVFCAEVEGTNSFVLEDNILTGNCFGCGAKGHIVHFCRDYHGLRNKLEAIYYLCNKYKIENTSDLILEGIKKLSVKIDEQRLLENANILVSNQCRMLLRKDFQFHKDWVRGAYKRINGALDKKDFALIDKISYEASGRIHLKGVDSE